MSTRRRWMPIGAGAAVVGLLTAGAASASFATGLTPGNTKFNNQNVNASFFDDQGNMISIQANSGLQSFRPRGGGPLITENTTTVQVSGYIQSKGLFGIGCWTVPTAAFVIRANDMSATFAFDSTAPGVADCPGDPLNPGEIVPSSLTSSGLSEGLHGGVSLTATWSPVGTTVEFRATTKTSCGAFGAVSESDTKSQNSTATTTVASLTVEGVDPDTGETVDISLAGTYSTDFALVDSGSFSTTVNGPSTGSCGPFGSDVP